jgi:hypothetical protein
MYSLSAFSQEKTAANIKIQGSKETPLELNLLLESLGNSIENTKILPYIMNIDSYARVLSKEDIFLIGKVEIYKTLLKTNEHSLKAIIDVNSTKTLKIAIKKAQDPFIKWFLQALLQDCETLLESSNYKEYLLQKNSGHLEGIELRKIDKKVQLIFRWVSKINPDSPDFQEILKTDLVPVMIDSLINIEESFFLIATNTIFEPFPGLIKSPAELKFFTLKEIKTLTKTVTTEKTLDEILSPITDETKVIVPTLPGPSKEDWLHEDNAPNGLKNLPKPTDDADWLRDF